MLLQVLVQEVHEAARTQVRPIEAACDDLLPLEEGASTLQKPAQTDVRLLGQALEDITRWGCGPADVVRESRLGDADLPGGFDLPAQDSHDSP